jgi:hypothetical protein
MANPESVTLGQELVPLVKKISMKYKRRFTGDSRAMFYGMAISAFAIVSQLSGQNTLEHVWEFLTVNEVFSDKYLAAA